MSDGIGNPGPKGRVRGLKAAVTTDSSIVTKTMLRVLRDGGNAADAAIAGALVQAAVEPYVTNHAGLVTLLYYEASTGSIYQLDSLGAFPSGLAPFQPVPAGQGIYAVTPPSAIIPGFMPGLKAFHVRFGTKPWGELCEDAVYWAERGHSVSTLEYGANVVTEKFITYFAEGRRFYQPNGYFPNVGETFQPAGLAHTLRGVAQEGPDYMICGPWARDFVSKANDMGWKISLNHMSETPPRWVTPVRFAYNEFEVVSLGPPQLQGIHLAICLGVMKHLRVREMQPGSADYFWAMGHALRQAQRHWEYAQDDSIYGVPLKELLDDAYHAHLAKMIRAARPKVDLSEHIHLTGETPWFDAFSQFRGASSGKPTRRDSLNAQPIGSCESAVVDANGNWVQMMNTLQGSGIPGMVVGGVPMIGSHATFGALQSPIDGTLVPGAKVRCAIGNTMVLKQGRPVLSVGTTGSTYMVPQVLVHALDFKMDPHAAVDAPRMLPMNENRTIIVEDRVSDEAQSGLAKLGVRLNVISPYDLYVGAFSVISRDEADGLYEAVADPRRGAVADGLCG